MLHVLLLARSNRVDLFLETLPSDEQEELIRHAMKNRNYNKEKMRQQIKTFNEKLMELRLQREEQARSQDVNRNRRRTQ